MYLMKPSIASKSKRKYTTVRSNLTVEKARELIIHDKRYRNCVAVYEEKDLKKKNFQSLEEVKESYDEIIHGGMS